MNEEQMTVEQFVDRFYKPNRLSAEPGRRERIIADRMRDMRERGEAFISGADSVTGEHVILYNPRHRPRHYMQWLATTDGESEHTD